MKTEVISVPQDKCPRDVLAKLGEKTQKAWIFLHEKVVEKLKEKAYSSCNDTQFTWVATKKRSETKIFLDRKEKPWYRVIQIDSDDIAFKECPSEPDIILFIEMEK